MTPVLESRSLFKSYSQTRVLSDVTFTLPAAGRLAVLGSSGCGKSTLLRIIAGLEDADSGETLISGKAVIAAGKSLVPPHLRGISMVFQDLGLWPNLTAAQNIALGLGSAPVQEPRVIEALNLLGISDLSARKPSQLSGGQQQRVALGAALVSRPKLLLLDEPFTGLDWLTKERLLEEIRRITTQAGIALIMVTHDPFEARNLCDQVLTLDEGRTGDFGNWQDAIKSPRSPILKRFITEQ
jgi:iron(III) transport system ATP-binding protein